MLKVFLLINFALPLQMLPYITCQMKGDSNPSWEASYENRTLLSTYVEFVPKSAMKFYLDFAHRFHHDELHFMIAIQMSIILMLWCLVTSAQIGIYRRATSRYVCAKVGELLHKIGK